MNNILKNLSILIIFFLIQSCEGPVGPEGPIGLQGQPGINILGTTYEVEIDFNAENDYLDLFNFPIQLEESDGVLVYRLVGVENNKDIWRLLPQTYFFEEGILMYNFDYSVSDFAIFMDGPISYSSLQEQWRLDQIFRIIVIPADFPSSKINYNDYEGVVKMLGLSESDFVKLEPRK